MTDDFEWSTSSVSFRTMIYLNRMMCDENNAIRAIVDRDLAYLLMAIQTIAWSQILEVNYFAK